MSKWNRTNCVAFTILRKQGALQHPSTSSPLLPVPLATTDKSRPTEKRLFSDNSLTLHYSTKQEKLKEHTQTFYCQWSAWKKKQNKTDNHCFWWSKKFCHPIIIIKKREKKNQVKAEADDLLLMGEHSLWLAALDLCYYVRLIAGGCAAPSTRIILSSPPATCSPWFSSRLMSPVQPWEFQQGQPDTSAPKLNVRLQIGRVHVENGKRENNHFLLRQ